MTPYEARLAGGSFFYPVEADPERWPRGTNPLVVIARQAEQPDDSKMTLTFRTATQFRTPEPVPFRVEIRHGRVTEIVAATPLWCGRGQRSSYSIARSDEAGLAMQAGWSESDNRFSMFSIVEGMVAGCGTKMSRVRDR